VDAETGTRVLDAGEDGEVVVRTPGQFTGYWDNPGATRRSLDHRDWFRTGRPSTQ